MKKLLLISIPLLLLSSNSMACDDKACEAAYISSTQQYVANYGRHAISERNEREAHAKNRERRDYAIVEHLRRISRHLSHQRIK